MPDCRRGRRQRDRTRSSAAGPTRGRMVARDGLLDFPLMCGIAGFVNLDGAQADAVVLEAMTDMVRHRGPDDRSTLRLSRRGGIPDVALGFHRLAILDRSTRARQPMSSPDG